MRRRDFAIGLLLAVPAIDSAQAEQPLKQHRIAIVISTGPVTSINNTEVRVWQAFFSELRRLGDVEGQNLTVERYSGEGRPAVLGDLVREVVSRRPDVILAIGPLVTTAVTAATTTIPIVATGDYTSSGAVPSLAHPGGNMTGARIELGYEIWGKRLQILKEAVPSASKITYLDQRIFSESASGRQIREQLRQASRVLGGIFSESASGRQIREQLRQASRVLGVSLTDKLIEESTSSEYQQVFAQIGQDLQTRSS